MKIYKLKKKIHQLHSFRHYNNKYIKKQNFVLIADLMLKVFAIGIKICQNDNSILDIK